MIVIFDLFFELYASHRYIIFLTVCWNRCASHRKACRADFYFNISLLR